MEPKKPISKRELERKLSLLETMSLVVADLDEEKKSINKMQVIKDFKELDKQTFLVLTANDRNKLMFKILKALCKIEEVE